MAEEKEKSKFKLSKKLIIIISAASLVFTAILFTVFLLFFLGSDEDSENKDKDSKSGDQESVYLPGPEDFYPGLVKFGEIIVKLKPEFQEELAKNLRITIYAEVNEENDKYILVEKKNLIEQYLVSYFSGKKPSDIDEVTEKLIIKQKILKRINEISGKKIMKNIYFTEFLVLDW
jgi:flagellar basal body-associated protein FliL